jgi:hypothetical protein|tara:strand:- start:1112 stop:1492 length:381 start_codon:yes stop_codon:yes gene_type:complete
MKLIKLILIIIFSLTSCSDQKLSNLEKKYVDELHQWVKSGGDSNTVQSVVQANCSKLTMVMATKEENTSFIDKSNIEEYDFRAGFCMSAVIENVWPNQPGFTKKFRNEVCDEYRIPFIKVVCKEFI